MPFLTIYLFVHFACKMPFLPIKRGNLLIELAWFSRAQGICELSGADDPSKRGKKHASFSRWKPCCERSFELGSFQFAVASFLPPSSTVNFQLLLSSFYTHFRYQNWSDGLSLRQMHFCCTECRETREKVACFKIYLFLTFEIALFCFTNLFSHNLVENIDWDVNPPSATWSITSSFILTIILGYSHCPLHLKWRHWGSKDIINLPTFLIGLQIAQ